MRKRIVVLGLPFVMMLLSANCSVLKQKKKFVLLNCYGEKEMVDKKEFKNEGKREKMLEREHGKWLKDR